MSLPDFSGTGYLAGEAPDGLTTVVAVPVTATVQVLWRDPDTDEEHLVASATSAPDGTWRITGLNHELNYIVRGIKAGWNDVTVVGAVPTRMDLVNATGVLETNESGDGVVGSMLIEGGLPPYTVSVIDPLPYGLAPVLDYRTLTIVGTSDDWGRWHATLRITASNAVHVDVPVMVDINAEWTPQHLSAPPKIWMDWGSHFTESGGIVSAVSNRGSVGGEFQQATAAYRPQLVDAVLGDKRVLRFDGTNDWMVHPGGIFRNVASGWSVTLFKKLSAASNPSGACVIYEQSSPTASHTNRWNVLAIRGSTPGVGAFATRRQTTDATAVLGRSSSDVGVWVIRRDVADWSDGRAEMHVDGTLDAVDAAALTQGVTSNDVSPGLMMGAGAFPSNPGSFSDIDIAAVIAGSGASLPPRADFQRIEGYVAFACNLQSNLPDDHPFKTRRPYTATTDLQHNLATDPLVVGFVVDTSGTDVGAALGPAVTALGTWFNGGPSLSAGQGVSVMSDGDDITVTLTSITPPTTPAQAVLLDHKGMSIVTIPLTASGSDYSGSVPGALEDGEVYYLRIEAA